MKLRTVSLVLLASGVLQLAIAAYATTAFHLYKHPTPIAVEAIRSGMNATGMNANQAGNLNHQLEIILSNERSLLRAWSALWPLAPLALGFFALSQLGAAIWLFVLSRKEGVVRANLTSPAE